MDNMEQASETEIPDNLTFVDPKDWEDRLISYLTSLYPDSLAELTAGRLPEHLFNLSEDDMFADDEQPVSQDAPVVSTRSDTPQSLAEARRSPEWPSWLEATKIEAKTQDEKCVYEIIDRDTILEKALVLDGRWVYARKLNNTGQTVKFKARWVI